MSTSATAFIKRPDESSRDKKLELLNAQLKKLTTEITTVSQDIDSKLGKNTDKSASAPVSANDELKEIIKKQNDLKTKRNVVFDQLKNIDSKLKNCSKEIELALGSASNKAKEFKSIGEVEKEISNLERRLDEGGLTLVDEKRFIKQQSELNKIKKSLLAVQPLKSEVNDLKQQQIALKATLNKEYDNKSLQKEFESIQVRLNEQRSVKQANQQATNQLFNKRTALYAKRDEIYNKIRDVRSQFDNEFKSYKLKREQQKKAKDNEYKWEKLNSQKESDLTKLREDVIAAKTTPAFSEDIAQVEASLKELNPQYVAASVESIAAAVPGLAIVGEKKIVSRRKTRAPPTIKSTGDDLKEFKGAKKFVETEATVVANEVSIDEKKEVTLSYISLAVLGRYGISIPDVTNVEEVETAFKQLSAKKEELAGESQVASAKNVELAEKRLEEVMQLYAKREQELTESIEAIPAEE
ncbi:hypothetical protein QEN19_001405 [Hanseniaspora menglaensis]